MKYLIAVVLFLGILLGSLWAQEKHKTESPAPPVKTEEIKTPPADWLNSLDDYLALARVIQQLKQENGIDKLEIKASTMAEALKAKIPEGYTYDAATRRFVLIKPTPAPEKKP
jgi:hypothetical protein